MSSGIHELNTVVDDVFQTMEEIQALFQNWTPSSSLPFIHKVMHLSNTARNDPGSLRREGYRHVRPNRKSIL